MFKTMRVIAIAGSLLAMANLASAASIQGTVRGPNGKAWSGAAVKLEAKSTKSAPQMTKTDASGKYVFNGIANGVYSVTVMDGKQVKAFMENVKAASPKNLDFDVKAAQAGTAKKAKHMVWVPADTGSHIGGRWVEVDDGTTQSNDPSLVRGSSQSVHANYTNTNTSSGGGGH